MAPTTRVVTLECHQDEVDHLLLIDPMATKTMPVSSTERASAYSVSNKYGSTGTRPHIRNAVNVLSAAIHGERTA